MDLATLLTPVGDALEHLSGCGDIGGHSGRSVSVQSQMGCSPALSESASSVVPQILWVYL